MSTKFISSAKVVGFCIFISRILGLFREMLCAYIFGAGFVWDAFRIAYIIPNLSRRIFGEGALSAAFIPIFTSKLETKGKSEAFNTLNIVVTTTAFILVIILVAGVIATLIVPIFFGTAKVALICKLLLIMLPFMVFICLAAILGGALNSLNYFFIPAFVPVIANVIFIIALIIVLIFTTNKAIYIIAGAVVIGGVGQMAMQISPLIKNGFKFIPKLEPKGDVMKEVYALFLPVVFGLSIYQINAMLDYVIAERYLPDGAVSALSYANIITQFPLSIIGVSLATTSLPLMSSLYTKGEKNEFASVLSKGLRTCLFISIPACVGLIILANPIIKLLFEHGKFTQEATARSSWALLFFSTGIWCYASNMILARAFYAQKDAKTPVRIGIATTCLNLILNLLLVRSLHEGGIALATAISGLLNLAAMFVIIKLRFNEFTIAPIAKTFAKSVIASGIMALACYASLKAAGHFALGAFATKLANVAIPTLIGVLTFFAISYLLRIEELKLIFKKG